MPSQQRENLRDVVAAKVLHIPDYQRPYAWGRSQLQDLWDDLDLAGPSGKHYAGTLIFREPQPARFTCDKFGVESLHIDVVDGQQRLTTCLLLVERIRRRLVDLATAGIEDAQAVADDLRRTFGVFEDEHHVKVTRLTPGPEVESFWRTTLLDEPRGNWLATGDPDPRTWKGVASIDALERPEFLRGLSHDYERLRTDPERWQRYLAERQEWDALA